MKKNTHLLKVSCYIVAFIFISCDESSSTNLNCNSEQHIYNNVCERDDIDNCGEHGLKCAVAVEGWHSGDCVEKACIPSACATGRHPFENRCERDDISHCGTHDMDCATAIPGWANGTCENGTCKVTTCQNGLHVYENSCASDDIDNCGAHGASCRLTVNGWITGNCLQATCTVSECAEGMHVYANACESDNEFSAYKDCGTIAHDAFGCLDENIVKCTDGETDVITDCVGNEQFCVANDEAEIGYICKDPDPTDCQWNETKVAKGQTVCDGNLLKTCSALVDTEFDDGTDCADLDPETPICDMNRCREERYCGDDVHPGDIICNDDGTDKAECIDGNLVDLLACTARANAHPFCTYSTEAVCSDACDSGFTDINNTCEPIKTCIENREIYIESTNTCACNTEAHYMGTPNACHCELGYFEHTDHCKAGCLYADTEYVYGESVCSSAGKVLTCQPDGTMGEAPCEKGVCMDGQCEIRNCGDLHDGEYQCISGSLMICNDGTLAAADTPCTSNQLCLDGAHECVPKKSCTADGSMLDVTRNTCICNTETGWHGDGNSCSCKEDGYIPLNGVCVEKKNCDTTKETYNSTTNTCSCNTAAHWAGTAGNCKCTTNYVEIDEACELKKTCDTTKETYNSTTNTCSCNTAAHWAGTAGSCECEYGYVEIGGACELKKTCNSNEKYNELTNACACDYSRHYVGRTGSCKCENGYVEIGDACELKKTCDATKETYNSATNTCSCNTAAHWAGTAGFCECEYGYVEIGGACELKKTCDTIKETYNSTTNTCSCNTAAYWAGTAGSCECANGYVKIGNICELKKTCNDSEIYDITTNTCSCDYSRHFVGEASACNCESGYIRVGNVCELPKNCDAVRETYNSATNTCSCNTATHWAGTAGACECAIGYYQDGNTCKPDDAEHCRGLDCTAVSYWGDGICTESGQCQVTECIGDTHLYDDGTSATCEANTNAHCGSHINNCGAHGACIEGECACVEGFTRCGDKCVNTKTNIDNCGTCGNACAYNLSCINGKCLGNTNCSGTTYNTKTDLDHCGACNHRCSDGTTCIMGECVLAYGYTYCGDQKVTLGVPAHCESCAPCADGLLCQNNQCIEGQGQMICNGTIIDSRTDSGNCGSCNNVCQAGFECVNSACTRITNFSTSTSLTCNGQNGIRPYFDENNCAGCGITCANNNVCKAGTCTRLIFGHYEQDNKTSNGKEPIEWLIRDRNAEGQYLLISKMVLDVKPYNTTLIEIDWKRSTIRSWLNGYAASYNTVGVNYTSNNFINTAFTAAERAKIVESDVYPITNGSPPYPGTTTRDKIFLISNLELENAGKQYNIIKLTKAEATRYAIQKGVSVLGSESGRVTSDGTCTDAHCYAHWWSRVMDKSRPKIAVAQAPSLTSSSDGMYYYKYVDDTQTGIRPAMWVNLD